MGFFSSRLTGGLRLGIVLALASVASSATGCGSSSDPSPVTGTESLFAVPSSLDALSDLTFFDQPFPSDTRREADGKVRFAGWPNPFVNPLITEYIKDATGLLDGFSPVAPTYLRFTGPIDPGTLPPDPKATLASDASVQVVDVDPASPERGQRKLVMTHWQADEGSYWPSNTLGVMPILGKPLRPKTRYAVVVTSAVRAPGNGVVHASREVEEIVGVRDASDATRKVRDLYAPAIAELGSAGVAAKDIVHVAVFTTNDPTAEIFAVSDDVATSVPAPAARDWAKKDETPELEVYEGTYGPSPNYQAGTVPFKKPSDGGSFELPEGKPKLQGIFDLRFALAVPNAQKCPPPAGGYPIVLYAHGTGGDYRSFVKDGTARSLAGQCLASMGIDQIFHGTRPGAPPADDPQRESTIQLLFFNFDNPFAARTNNRQAAVDVVQQARLFTDTKVKVPAAVAKDGADIAFDASRITFFGHSQGGLNGPIFLAASNLARGGVLSGAGSVLVIALLEKTKPIDVAATVRVLIGLSDPDRAKELDEFHPALALAQSLVDATDPVHYGSFITTAPRAGFAPKSIYQTEGVASDGTGDSYAPPHGIEALSVAIGLPRVSPGTKEIPEAGWAGILDVAVPPEGLAGNLAGGRATGALAQFAPARGRDGHFVVFDVPEARLQAAGFLKNLAADPAGRLPR